MGFVLPLPPEVLFSLFPPPSPHYHHWSIPPFYTGTCLCHWDRRKITFQVPSRQPITSSKKALFLLILFSPLSDPPKRCDFNGVHYNLGDTWNPFLLPSGYFRCIKCACKLVGIPCRCEKYVKGDESTEIILISLVDLLGKTFAGMTV